MGSDLYIIPTVGSKSLRPHWKYSIQHLIQTRKFYNEKIIKSDVKLIGLENIKWENWKTDAFPLVISHVWTLYGLFCLWIGAQFYLCDSGVCALAIDAIVLEPHALRVRTVLFQRATVLSLTPHTAEQRVCLQTHSTALPPCVTLVQVHWGYREGKGQVRVGDPWDIDQSKMETDVICSNGLKYF